jgi:hypothetical protein
MFLKYRMERRMNRFAFIHGTSVGDGSISDDKGAVKKQP